MTEIPDWIDDQISFKSNRDVQDRHIIEVFLESDRPYLSRSQIQTAVGLSDQGTRDRLRNLEERGIIDQDAVADSRVYWVHNEKSSWPIPPDVEVEPARNEPTISEFFGQTYVLYGVVAVAATMVGSLLVSVFTIAVGYNLPVPFVQVNQLLLWGIVAVGIGYVFVIGSALLWIWDRSQRT